MQATEQGGVPGTDLLREANERLLVTSLRALDRADNVERALLSGLPDAIARFDAEGRYLWANEAELRTLAGAGGDLAGCIGRSHAELGLPAEIATRWTALIAACFESGAPSDVLIRFEERPPRFLLVRAFLREDEDAPSRSVVTVSRDVTASVLYQDAVAHAEQARVEQHRAESLLAREQASRAAVEELTQRQRALLSALPDDVMVIDPTGRVRQVVKPAPAAGMASSQGTLGAALAAAQERIAQAVARAQASGLVQRLAIDASLPGKPAFELRIAPLEGDQALCVARDATELTLLRAHAAFNDRLVAMGTVAASVAHEVNNPLAALSLASELLLDELRDPEHRSLAQDICESAQRIRTIVSELRLFSRRDLAEPELVDVDAVLRSAQKLVRSHFDAGVVPTYVARPVSPVLGSATALGQVFVNLLVNAAQALRASGAKRVEVRLYEDGEGVHVIVADSGNGLTEEARQHLFEAFFTTREGHGGTGLGLHVSNGIVTSLGGRLFADDGLEGGCAVHVVLPAAAPGPEPSLPPPSMPPVVAPRRVLVVDDDLPLLNLYPRLLPEHAVRLASSGAEAIAAIEKEAPFDIVLCDLRMPIVSGADVYAVVAARWPGLARRFVIVTGGGVDVGALVGLEAAGVPVLTKPFGRDQLIALIARFGDASTACAED